MFTFINAKQNLSNSSPVSNSPKFDSEREDINDGSRKRRKIAFRPPIRFAKIPSSNQVSQADNPQIKHDVFQPRLSPIVNNGNYDGNILLHSVEELPLKFHNIFKTFRYFNAVQSAVFKDVFYSNKSLAVCAPTGSGKTVIMELAIASLLQETEMISDSFKIIYMAPMKALCSERFTDWSEKFENFGLRCTELTGDTDIDDFSDILRANLIFTTPEKWDSTTRRWRDTMSLICNIKLFLIDEIHVLNDENRGATIEAVISRMLTISCYSTEKNQCTGIRMIGVSATIPNVNDFATWFESTGKPAVSHKLSEELRPVKLRKEVLGYYCSEKWTDFKFDLNLSYKLSSVIFTYADGKPTLVFCSTRKGAMQAAEVLSKEIKFRLSPDQKQNLSKTAFENIKDNKLKEAISCGVGIHHAGLDYQDRKAVEQLFNEGMLLVLTATSTLAMGVNMPAHLVIIKSTSSCIAGSYVEYSNAQILQMIGRAGRPQFDTSATAVIMTKNSLKEKYEKFLNGNEVVESRLHKKFTEYINAEIVLNTITNLSIALQWIRSTFFYVRVLKNPGYYGIENYSDKATIESILKDMCLKELKCLQEADIIAMDGNFNLRSTGNGRLMARYCISLDTTKKFVLLKCSASLKDLIELISTCNEFSDVQLRTSEKRALNTLNNDKHLPTIRYTLTGKVRNKEMKINCLIQAVFGCLTIQDVNLLQESLRIIRIGQRLAKFLFEIVFLNPAHSAQLLVLSLNLVKCFNAKLWEDSQYVSRQLDKIGVTMATALTNAGLNNFEKIQHTHPRQLELIVNRHPPFGNHIRDAVVNLPYCYLKIEQTEKRFDLTAEVVVSISINRGSENNTNCTIVLIIGDVEDKIIFKQKLNIRIFNESNIWSKQLTVYRAEGGDKLTVNLINENYVGLDDIQTFTPFYSKLASLKSIQNPIIESVTQSSRNAFTQIAVDSPDLKEDFFHQPLRRSCNHHCLDKKSCSHECCKSGVLIRNRKCSSKSQDTRPSTRDIEFFKDVIPEEENNRPVSRLRQTTIDSMSYNLKKFPPRSLSTHIEKEETDKNTRMTDDLQTFNYDRKTKIFREPLFNRTKPFVTEKPNFEIILESDGDSEKDIPVFSVESDYEDYHLYENKSNLLQCDKIGNNFLSAKKVYENVLYNDGCNEDVSNLDKDIFIKETFDPVFEKKNNFLNFNEEVECRKVVEIPKLKGKVVEIPKLKGKDEVALSTFMNLFEELF